MFGLSGEHLLILAVVLIIFGPRKLPELGASIGKAMKNFKEGLNGPSSSGQLESKTPVQADRVQFTPAATASAPASTPAVNASATEQKKEPAVSV